MGTDLGEDAIVYPHAKSISRSSTRKTRQSKVRGAEAPFDPLEYSQSRDQTSMDQSHETYHAGRRRSSAMKKKKSYLKIEICTA